MKGPKNGYMVCSGSEVYHLGSSGETPSGTVWVSDCGSAYRDPGGFWLDGGPQAQIFEEKPKGKRLCSLCKKKKQEEKLKKQQQKQKEKTEQTVVSMWRSETEKPLFDEQVSLGNARST